jgi:hypothetical protein
MNKHTTFMLVLMILIGGLALKVSADTSDSASPTVQVNDVSSIALSNVANAQAVNSDNEFGTFTDYNIADITLKNNNVDGFDILVQPDATSQVGNDNEGAFVRSGVAAADADDGSSAKILVTLYNASGFNATAPSLSNTPKSNGLTPDDSTGASFTFTDPTTSTHAGTVELWIGVADSELQSVLVNSESGGSVFTVTLDVSITEN